MQQKGNSPENFLVEFKNRRNSSKKKVSSRIEKEREFMKNVKGTHQKVHSHLKGYQKTLGLKIISFSSEGL